jgi:hypothetical protein
MNTLGASDSIGRRQSSCQWYILKMEAQNER